MDIIILQKNMEWYYSFFNRFWKRAFGWTDKSGTRWKFCLIPLGGYVKFFDDHNFFSDYNRVDLN